MVINHLNLSLLASDASLPPFNRVSWVSDVGLGRVGGRNGVNLEFIVFAVSLE